MNELALYTSFMSAILYVKSGMHITASAPSFKRKVEAAAGLPKGTPYGVYAVQVQVILYENDERYQKKCNDFAKSIGVKVRMVKQGKFKGNLEYYNPSKK